LFGPPLFGPEGLGPGFVEPLEPEPLLGSELGSLPESNKRIFLNV